MFPICIGIRFKRSSFLLILSCSVLAILAWGMASWCQNPELLLSPAPTLKFHLRPLPISLATCLWALRPLHRQGCRHGACEGPMLPWIVIREPCVYSPLNLCTSAWQHSYTWTAKRWRIKTVPCISQLCIHVTKYLGQSVQLRG